MDLYSTIKFLDRFMENHRTPPCSAAEMDVSFEPGVVSSDIRLQCPSCLKSITGTIQEEDWPDAIQWMKTTSGRVN